MLDNRGQMRTIEAFLAILLLFSTIALTTTISPASNVDNDDPLATLGIQSLVSMDNDGRLGRLIDDGNWTDLADALSSLLPVGISYNLTICDKNSRTLNDVPISNGIASDYEMVSVQYPCASPASQGNCYLIRLQLARVR